MFFYPQKHETIISGLACDIISERLRKYVFIIDPGRPQKTPVDYPFNGMQFDDEWRLSLTTSKGNNFLPIAHFRTEPANANCLAQVTYRLFPSTRRSLVIWSSLSLFTCLFFILLHREWFYGTLCLAIGFVNYILTRENFRIQVGETSRALHRYLINGTQ